MRSGVLPTFSSIMFSVSGFMLRSLIHLDLRFVHGDRYGSIFILLHFDIQLCQHHLLNMFLFLFYIFSFFVKNQGFIGVWIDTQVFDSIPLVLLSVFIPIPGCFQHYRSVVEFEVRDCDASRSSFMLQDYLGYTGFFFFSIWSWLLFCEEFFWDFDGQNIESVGCFW